MAGQPLKLQIVTPERMVFDQEVAALRFPLFDGDFGVLPGHAPVIGRLGFGELKITGVDQSETSLFLDGGFVQIRGQLVTLLTQRAVPVKELSIAAAQQAFEAAQAKPSISAAEHSLKTTDLLRTRRMLNLAQRAGKP